MQQQTWREKAQPWLGFGFCSFLSLITLPAVALSREVPSGLIAFLCFLPMCFFYNTTSIILLRKQIDELQSRLDAKQ